MQFRLAESEFKKSNLLTHADQHRKHYKNDDRFSNVTSLDEFATLYNQVGDRLSRKRVGKSDAYHGVRYVGYITKDGRYVKYDKKYHDFLVYSYDKIITLHKKSYTEYVRILQRDFGKEFPYNETEEPSTDISDEVS